MSVGPRSTIAGRGIAEIAKPVNERSRGEGAVCSARPGLVGVGAYPTRVRRALTWAFDMLAICVDVKSLHCVVLIAAMSVVLTAVIWLTLSAAMPVVLMPVIWVVVSAAISVV